MEQIVKELKGHSGSQILLMKNDRGLFVRKINNVDRYIVLVMQFQLFTTTLIIGLICNMFMD